MKRITVCLCLVVLLFSASSAFASSTKIGIIVFDGFLTSDVTAPVEVFGAASKKSVLSSYEVVVVSTTKNKTVVSEEGLKVVADKTIYDDLEFDVVIVPSAYSMDKQLGNTDLVNFIQKQGAFASWMASNCSGAFLLGEAGLLDGKIATTWAGGETDLAKAYSKIEVQFDQNVVIDDKVITSNGGAVSYQSAFVLLAKLSSEKFSKEISESIQFDRLERAFKQ